MLELKPNADSGWVSSLANFNVIKDKLFFVALVLVAIAVFVPFSPGMPRERLDPSWVYGMNEAFAQGMSFGKDIVFTFGPYASIYTKTYHPATDQLMIWGALYLAVSFSVAAYLNFRSTGWPLMIALFAVLSAVMYSRDALFFFYPMLVGVQVYRWAISLDSKKTAGLDEIALKVVLFAPFGLFPLIKGSTLIASAAITVLSIALLAKRGQWRLCLLVGATPFVSLVIFWTLSGQSLIGLADYFVGLALIISGYTEAMAMNGDPIEYIFYTFATATLVVFLLREAQGSAYDKSLVALVFLCILFLAFKAGFVRHDGHAICSGTMILLGALLAGTLITARSSLTLLVVCLVAWLSIDAAHIKTSSHSIKRNIKNTYFNAWIGLKQRTTEPEALERAFEARVNELNERGAITKLRGSVDIYSYDQSYLIASGNKWNPRPVFQSYSVYNSRLAHLNKKHLLSGGRPDNIVFKLQPIDGRLPSLEDGASWPVILSNYEPTSASGGYLYLKSRSTSNQTYEQPRKIGGGVYSLGEKIILPDSGAPLFVKATISKSFAGTILNVLFKPSRLAIELTMHDGASRSYRIVAGMAESGFIISPLVENTEEFGLLFSGVNYLNDKKVKSIEIVAKGRSLHWKRSFEIDFYELDYQPSPDFVENLGFSNPNMGNFKNMTTVQRCDGSIDHVNGVSPAPGSIRVSSLLSIDGWLAASLDPVDVPDTVYLVLSNLEGKRYFIDAERAQRPDVGAHFGKPLLNSSGYVSTADVSNLNGDYSLGLAYSRDNELFMCPEFNIQVKIHQE